MTLTSSDDLDFGTKEKVLVRPRYTHMKCESYIAYHSKVMANVKVALQTNRQTNNRQSKRYIPRSIDAGVGGNNNDSIKQGFNASSQCFI